MNVRRSVSRSAVILSFVSLALLVPACRKPADQTPEGTLGLLRSSLTTHQPPIDKIADVRLVEEATAIAGISDVDNRMGIPGTEGALDARIALGASNMTADHVFAGALTLLGSGHCEKIADGALPAVLSQAPPAGRGWNGRLLAMQQSVARRLTTAFAADFRCDGGPSFRAAFVHQVPSDPTLRVVWLGPSSER